MRRSVPEQQACGRALLVVALFGLGQHLRYAMALHGAFHFANDMHREETHPLLLVRVERLVERLPRVGELLQVGASLSEGLGASPHEFDRIKFALTGLVRESSKLS